MKIRSLLLLFLVLGLFSEEALFAQACMSLDGDWTDTDGIYYHLTQDSSGNVSGTADLSSLGCGSLFSVSGYVNYPNNNYFEVTASGYCPTYYYGGGAALTWQFNAGYISSYPSCGNASGTYWEDNLAEWGYADWGRYISSGLSCSVTPSGESVSGVGWLPEGQSWNGTYQWSVTLTGGSFEGMAVTEVEQSQSDTCHFNGSSVGEFHLTGSTWLIDSSNQLNYGGDFIGYWSDAAIYYRQQSRASCAATFTQRMVMQCVGNYIDNAVSSTVGASTIESCKASGHCSGARTWPNLDAPTSFTAAVSGSQINLSWSIASVDQTGFRIERKEGADGTWAFLTNRSANQTSYADTGVTVGIVYYYRIRAVDDYSNIYHMTAASLSTDNGPWSSTAYDCRCTIATNSGTYDGNSSSYIVYDPACCGSATGWWIDNVYYPNASGGTEEYSKDSGASAKFSFVGTSLTWRHLLYHHMGIASVTIDGNSMGTVDLYSGSDLWAQDTTYSGLTSGAHTITITVTGSKNASSSDYFVDIDALIVS